MSGFDCQFTEEPPEVLQCYCPICLLILREPYQVTCCGKSYCRACIQEIEANSQSCPTCNKQHFENFQNKGLQQPLYGLEVFCSNKEGGCGWHGELGQLDQHLNENPDKDSQLVGCVCTEVKCLFCSEVYHRQKIKSHQASQCSKRPFICEMCKNFESSYEEVTTIHAPKCKCRPVECPNSCGGSNMQHQHLEEHMSSQCPLTLVECEFSDAGCDAKVYRRDLPSHLKDNMVTHMSLLARENRKLKKETQDLKEKLAEERKFMQSLFQIPPVTIKGELCSGSIRETFYSHTGGYKLQLHAKKPSLFAHILLLQFYLLESEFTVHLPCKLKIITKIVDQKADRDHIVVKHTISSNASNELNWAIVTHKEKHHLDYNFIFHVTDVTIL